MLNLRTFFLLLGLSLTGLSSATPDKTQLSVWVNEAIVTTYTYNAANFIQREKEIAKYFTSTAWISYSTALTNSKLPDSVQKNAYEVSAVATLPPTIKTIDPQHWQATMPLLVLYKNPQYQQKQTLEVTMSFTAAPSGQGVRGFAITSLQSRVTQPACRCEAEGPRAAIV